MSPVTSLGINIATKETEGKLGKTLLVRTAHLWVESKVLGPIAQPLFESGNRIQHGSLGSA